LAAVLARDAGGLELRADPTELAPERLLVFEVRGAVSAFADAVRRVPGLELIDEEELQGDGDEKAPVAYLMVPDARALQQLEGLWRRWLNDQLRQGETPWRDVFELLRDLRPWGPQDRVRPEEAHILSDEIDGLAEDDLVRIEVELVFRKAATMAANAESEVVAAIQAQNGQVVSRTRIEDIAYHAILADLPVASLRSVIARASEGIVALDAVMHIRPQSAATTLHMAEDGEPTGAVVPDQLGEPILALLDGVPVAAHPLLTRHLVVDDQFSLEPNAVVAERVHGTAMASLIVHGDRNKPEAALPRRIHVVPVLRTVSGQREQFPNDRLIVDVIYTAIQTMREGLNATAPGVLLINVSLGNQRRPFYGQLSPWARLLDCLAHRFGILFVVSAGNADAFAIPAFATGTEYEDASASDRAAGTLLAVGAVMADRRLLSPAETVNGITVGACNVDAVSTTERRLARAVVDPYGDITMANASSRLGPGFAAAVKPDVLFPGAREHLRVIRNHPHIEVRPTDAGRFAGLKVAAPPRDGRENNEGFSNGTSAAAALAARTAHRIHDALERAYGEDFLNLGHRQRAVLLKALLAHTARWPVDTAKLIRDTIGPTDGRQHVRQKDNIRRFLGFGLVEPDDAVACTDDRATFWAIGELLPNKIAVVNVPVPIAMHGQARPHALAATVAWFTPTAPGRKSYRNVRLKLLNPGNLTALAVEAHGDQPDGNQTNRGTVFMRRWIGDRAPVIGSNLTIPLTVQRDPDQGTMIDDPVPFGLAVTLTMPGVVEIYEQVRQRLGLAIPQRV
jgi:hypothetical protein